MEIACHLFHELGKGRYDGTEPVEMSVAIGKLKCHYNVDLIDVATSAVPRHRVSHSQVLSSRRRCGA